MNDGITMIVVTAGRGRRFGGPLPKQYHVLQGRPLLLHTLSRLHAHPFVACILPIIAPDGDGLWQETMGPHLAALPKVSPPVFGGETRQQSVYNGLRSLQPKKNSWVGIHDGARPLVSRELLDSLLKARATAEALVPVLPVNDTVKQVDSRDQVCGCPDRRWLRLAQTPQLFILERILKAHAMAAKTDFLGTDDASLLEHMGATVQTIPGSEQNIKVTTPRDLALAEWLLAREQNDPPSSLATMENAP